METNRLLASLPAAEYDRLLPKLETISCTIGTTLVQADAPIAWLYFPRSLIASVVIHIGKQMVEACTTGREGFVGLPAVFGYTSSISTVVQIPGETYRVHAMEFVDLLPQLPVLSLKLRRYALSMLDEASQSAACNRAHAIEKRCAKWLLLIHDRLESDQFPITHKYLATMLGVRRAGVTIAAGMLQKEGIIRYSRGKMSVINREALESSACGCYKTIRRNRERLADGTRMPELA